MTKHVPPKKTLSNLPVSEIQEIFNRANSVTSQLISDVPKLSVLMPFYRAYNIGWVAFESLIRQKGVDFAWELIVIEENFIEPMGLAEILKYASSLKKIGCCKITYVPLDSWIPLSAKWYYLAKMAHPDSKVFALHSADGYSAPERLSKQFKILSEGKYNWYRLTSNIVYDIETDHHVQFFLSNMEKYYTHSRAITANLFKKLPLASIKSSVDGWTFKVLSQEGEGVVDYLDRSDIGNYTININGLNCISFGRGKRVREHIPPLYACCSDLENHLPEEVVQRLKTYSQAAKQRREEREKDKNISPKTRLAEERKPPQKPKNKIPKRKFAKKRK